MDRSLYDLGLVHRRGNASAALAAEAQAAEAAPPLTPPSTPKRAPSSPRDIMSPEPLLLHRGAAALESRRRRAAPPHRGGDVATIGPWRATSRRGRSRAAPTPRGRASASGASPRLSSSSSLAMTTTARAAATPGGGDRRRGGRSYPDPDPDPRTSSSGASSRMPLCMQSVPARSSSRHRRTPPGIWGHEPPHQRTDSGADARAKARADARRRRRRKDVAAGERGTRRRPAPLPPAPSCRADVVTVPTSSHGRSLGVWSSTSASSPRTILMALDRDLNKRAAGPEDQDPPARRAATSGDCRPPSTWPHRVNLLRPRCARLLAAAACPARPRSGNHGRGRRAPRRRHSDASTRTAWADYKRRRRRENLTPRRATRRAARAGIRRFLDATSRRGGVVTVAGA